MIVKLRQNVFGHWILVDAADESRAFTGMRFVEVDARGFNHILAISNFSSKNAAYQYARMYGFEVQRDDQQS